MRLSRMARPRGDDAGGARRLFVGWGQLRPRPTIRIGSDSFYESKLMAEIYAQALEARRATR